MKGTLQDITITVDDIDKAGHLLSDQVAATITEQALAATSYYRSLFGPVRPLTRRDRLRLRWYGIRDYLAHLRRALVNDCDRECDCL